MNKAWSKKKRCLSSRENMVLISRKIPRKWHINIVRIPCGEGGILRGYHSHIKSMFVDFRNASFALQSVLCCGIHFCQLAFFQWANLWRRSSLVAVFRRGIHGIYGDSSHWNSFCPWLRILSQTKLKRFVMLPECAANMKLKWIF